MLTFLKNVLYFRKTPSTPNGQKLRADFIILLVLSIYLYLRTQSSECYCQKLVMRREIYSIPRRCVCALHNHHSVLHLYNTPSAQILRPPLVKLLQ